MTYDVAGRMAQILAGPPRLEPLASENLSARERKPIDYIRELTGSPTDTPVSSFFLTLAHQPEFFEGYMQMGISAMSAAALAPRLRELLILRTGWLCGAPYQFGEHVDSGKRAGITSEEIAWVKQGSIAPGWSDHERTLLKAAEELHADAMISDDTWSALAERLDPAALIEVTMIVGHYVVTAYVQNTLRIGLRRHNDGLAAH